MDSAAEKAGIVAERRALRRLNLFGASWMAVPLMPAYVPFLVAHGFRTGDVLDLQAVYSLGVMLFEIPTGLISDLLGRRRTLIAGAVLNLVGYAGFAAARGFASLAAVQLVLAAGWSLVSGADVALLYDVADRTGAGRDRRRAALGRYTAAQVMGEAVASLAGGLVATWSLAAVGWATALEAVIPLLLAFRLPDGAPPPSSALATVRLLPDAARWLLGHALPRLLFLNAVLWGLSTFVAVWLLQPYWREQGIGLRWFGLLWAGTLVTVAIASRLAAPSVRLAGQRAMVTLLAILPVLAYAGLAAFGGWAGVASGFLFYLSRGLNAVVLREAFNHLVPSALRATFNSLGSGLSRFGFALLGPVVGLVSDRHGLGAALRSLALLFLVAFAVLAVPLARRLPGRRDAGTAQ